MRQPKEKVFIRVAAQLTFSWNRISLLAEESVPPFKKGDLVANVSRVKFNDMLRPCVCEIRKSSKGENIVKPVTHESLRIERNEKPSVAKA